MQILSKPQIQDRIIPINKFKCESTANKTNEASLGHKVIKEPTMQTGRDISPQCALGVEVAADDSGSFFSKLRVPIPTTSVSIQISQGEGYKLSTRKD